MAKQSFADVPVVPEPEPTPAPAESSPASNTSSSTSSSSAQSPASSSPAAPPPEAQPLTVRGGGELEGAFDRSDLKLPRVNLAQKSGKLGDTFPPGSYVLAKSVRLSDGKEPFFFIVLGLKKQYQEDIKFDPEVMPNTCNSPEEVRAAGGSLKYGDEHYYKKIATAMVLVEAPTGLSADAIEEYFPYEVEGKFYALALWTFGGTSYTTCATKLFTARELGHLKGGFFLGRWSAKSLYKSNATFSWHTPDLANAGKTTETFQAFCKELLK